MVGCVNDACPYKFHLTCLQLKSIPNPTSGIVASHNRLVNNHSYVRKLLIRRNHRVTKISQSTANGHIYHLCHESLRIDCAKNLFRQQTYNKQVIELKQVIRVKKLVGLPPPALELLGRLL